MAVSLYTDAPQEARWLVPPRLLPAAILLFAVVVGAIRGTRVCAAESPGCSLLRFLSLLAMIALYGSTMRWALMWRAAIDPKANSTRGQVLRFAAGIAIFCAGYGGYLSLLERYAPMCGPR
jgi:hypothetical protein